LNIKITTKNGDYRINEPRHDYKINIKEGNKREERRVKVEKRGR
jgi:hypothetical protein